MLSEGYRRRFALFVSLIVFVLGVSATYAWLVIQSTRAGRVALALERNQTTAELCARLLDQQRDDAASATRRLASGELFRIGSSPSEIPLARERLATAVALIPDLIGAAICAADGTTVLRVDSLPPSLPNDALLTAWIRGTRPTAGATLGRVIRVPVTAPSSDPSRGWRLLTAAPLTGGRGPQRFLVTAFLPPDIITWLRQVRIPGATLYIVDEEEIPIAAQRTRGIGREGDVVAVTAAGELRNLFGGPIRPQTAARLSARKDTLISVARSRLGWSVVVAQPMNAAVETVDRLVLALSLLAIPVLLVVLVTVVSLARLHRALELMNARLEAADRLRSDFVVSVSHDLRTPLTGAQIAISGLLDPAVAVDPARLRESLTAASAEIHCASRRVQNLLRISRLEAGLLTPHSEMCDLTDVALAAVERLAPILGERSVDIEFPPRPLLTEADQEQIGTVVENLLENAHKYAPAGTPIHLRGERRGNRVRVLVCDHGPGIPPGDERKVFERYYRAGDTPATTEGTGLGLAIARGIVLAHGGALGVKNAPDGGAQFWFTLPAVEVPAAAREEVR